MDLDELIEKLNEIKTEHPMYGRFKVVTISKKGNDKNLIDVKSNIINSSWFSEDKITLVFE